MRRLFTTEQARGMGLTRAALRWGERQGCWVHVARDVYADGGDPPNEVDVAVAALIRGGGVARGHLAGVLLGLDSVTLQATPRKRDPPTGVVDICGVRCADGFQTLDDLALLLDDDAWEQAMESALRKRLVTIDELRQSRKRRAKRVLAKRPDGAPPTESLLETLMVQLARLVPGLGLPQRQVPVGPYRVDLAWPELGLFVELDGEHHKDQPLYDSRRETAIVAATGWLCGRFTWSEVTRVPRATARRLAELAAAARRRRLE